MLYLLVGLDPFPMAWKGESNALSESLSQWRSMPEIRDWKGESDALSKSLSQCGPMPVIIVLSGDNCVVGCCFHPWRHCRRDSFIPTLAIMVVRGGVI
jgi:hypothetical protein